MRKGDRIRHPELGEGTVTEVYVRGGQPGAELDFGYMREWVSLMELGVEGAEEYEVSQLNPSVSDSNNSTTSPSPPRLTKNMMDARRGVLALKLGQILEEHVLDLSIGTEDAQAKLEEVVSCAVRRQAGSVLIEGAWGSGKTHLLTMLSTIAGANGFATSSVILDGVGVTLSDPMGLMRAVLDSLRYPGEPVPIGIGRRLVKLRSPQLQTELRQKGGARITNAIAEIPPSALDEPEVLQALEDYFTLSVATTHAKRELAKLGYRCAALPPMAARAVADRPDRFCELLKCWTEFVALTGAKGLVLIIDEMDVEYASTLWSSVRRERRTDLLRALGTLLKLELPLVVAFGSAPAGGDVAEIDDAAHDLAKCLRGIDLEVEAPRPSLKQMCALARRLSDLYEQAYPDCMAGIDRDDLSKQLDDFAREHMKSMSPVPRNFVRGTLERLDVMPSLCRQAVGD